MREFETGRAPVAPPPSPWDTVASWGRTGEIPRPPEGRPWVAPGPPPATNRRAGTPGWAIALIVAGAVLLAVCGGFTVAGALIGAADPAVTSTPTPAAPELSVVASGSCDKKIIGEYGLVASVAVENQTDAPAVGRVWVRWRLTGEEPITHSKGVELAPGERFEYHLNEPIEGERWFRVEGCDYGWTPKD